ncbi:MAG: hypothetical protein NT045_02595 [Candidatus Aureabacteria bacterium]|nr:hypothetical protein [Candidatus Auribacterota bacterium]
MKLLQFCVKMVKFFIGLWLVPACAGVTLAFFKGMLGPISSQYWCLAGMGSFVVIFAIFQQPIKSYVFGHELTHAFWILLFQGKVTTFSASSKGGKVEGTKGNFFIALSPYFFPVYTILLIALYFIGKLFWEPQQFTSAFIFLIGFTWAFHIILTMSVLIKGQAEVKQNGYLFSLTVIYIMNIIVLGLVLTFISPDFAAGDLVRIFSENISVSYARFGNAATSLSRSFK